MVVDVAAAAVGLALAVLYKGIEELIRQYMIEKSMEFKPLLEKIRMKLEVLRSEIKEIEKSNQELDRPEMKDFTKVIADGTELVDKLKEVGHWYKKPKYTNKLHELDESLNTQMMLLGVRSARELNKVSVITDIIEGHTANIRMQMGNMSIQMGNMNTKLDTNVEMLKEIRRDGLVQNQTAVGWLGVPEPPSFIVGFDLHLDALKTKLLKDGVSMVLLTGHPGSGKTTLAKSFCQVKEVKGNISYLFLLSSRQ